MHNLQLAAEDALQLSQNLDTTAPVLKVAVPVFSRISNHTDFDSLRIHPQIDLVYVPVHNAIPPCDLILLPGSKNVRADLALLKQMQWDQQIARHLRYGGKVLGICGGYQMLGEQVDDLLGIEGPAGTSRGLGYLPVRTHLTAHKQLTKNCGTLLLNDPDNRGNCSIKGYQIHVGQSEVGATAKPFVRFDDHTVDGCISADNQVAGTYLHGLFDDPNACARLLSWAGLSNATGIDYQQQQEQEISRLAKACTKHLNWSLLQPYLSL